MVTVKGEVAGEKKSSSDTDMVGGEESVSMSSEVILEEEGRVDEGRVVGWLPAQKGRLVGGREDSICDRRVEVIGDGM